MARRGRIEAGLGNRRIVNDAPHMASLGNPWIVLLSSNHVMVNRLRTVCGKNPVTRSVFLDEVARNHAISMASKQSLFPVATLSDDLKIALKTTNHVGENSHRGKSIRSVHESILQEKDRRSLENMLSEKFTEFGVGTAQGDDGQLYVCQLFREGSAENR